MATRAFIPRAIAWALRKKPVRAFLLYSEHRGPLLADSVTYRTLFSLFAAVFLGFSLAALWLADNPEAWQALLSSVNNFIPGLVGDDGLIETTTIEAPAGLTVAGIIATVGLVGAAIGAIGSLRTALRNIADRGADDVAFYWVLLRNLLLAIGIGGALAAAAAITVLGTAGVGLVAGWLGLSSESPLVVFSSRAVAIAIVFVLDAVAVAVLFRALSGVQAKARTLWIGALLGAVGLSVLQQLSGLFVGGAGNNPLLASFASLVALLLWINLSAQVILLASAYIVVGVEEDTDRVGSRDGATTFAERRMRRAEHAVTLATEELRIARDAVAVEREGENTPTEKDVPKNA